MAVGCRSRKLAHDVMEEAFQRGLLLLTCGASTIRFCPPLVLTEDEAIRAAEIVGAAIEDAAAGRVDAEEVAKYAGW